MAALHLVNRPSALAACLELADAADVVLLLQDGVYAGVREHGRALLALADDVAARGLAGRVAASTSIAGYDDFVALVVAHRPIVSWR